MISFFFSVILTDFNYFPPIFFSLQIVQYTVKTGFKWGWRWFQLFFIGHQNHLWRIYHL